MRPYAIQTKPKQPVLIWPQLGNLVWYHPLDNQNSQLAVVHGIYQVLQEDVSVLLTTVKGRVSHRSNPSSCRRVRIEEVSGELSGLYIKHRSLGVCKLLEPVQNPGNEFRALWYSGSGWVLLTKPIVVNGSTPFLTHTV